MGDWDYVNPSQRRLSHSLVVVVAQIVFDYRQINSKRPETAYPAADLWIRGKDGRYRLFKPHADSGAAISVLTASDAIRLGLELRAGEPSDLYGVSGTLKAYVHRVRAKIGGKEFKTSIAFSVSDETPRLLGRKDIFKYFVVSFRESKKKTYFTEEPTEEVSLCD